MATSRGDLTPEQDSALTTARLAIDVIRTRDNLPDYKNVEPLDHVSQLTGYGEPLAQIIRSPEVAELVLRRTKAPRGKTRSQAVRAWLLRGSVLLILLPLALALWIALFEPTSLRYDVSKWIYRVIFALACAALAANAILFYKNSRSWTRLPEETKETLRRKLFERLTAQNGSGSAASQNTLLLQLEYFRRFQLDAQIDYYKWAISRIGGELRPPASIAPAVWLLGAILAICAALQGAAIASEQGHDMGFPGLSGLALYIEAWSFMNIFGTLFIIALVILAQFYFTRPRDHRALYGPTMRALERIRDEQLEPARLAAAKGNPAPFLSMVRQVHDEMEREHSAWLQYD